MAKGEGRKTEVHLRALRVGPPLDKVRRGVGTTALLSDGASLDSAFLQLVVGQAHRVQERIPAWVAVEIFEKRIF
jgi:hypothetical protein